jgi:hypothetical protein
MSVAPTTPIPFAVFKACDTPLQAPPGPKQARRGFGDHLEKVRLNRSRHG